MGVCCVCVYVCVQVRGVWLSQRPTPPLSAPYKAFQALLFRTGRGGEGRVLLSEPRGLEALQRCPIPITGRKFVSIRRIMSDLVSNAAPEELGYLSNVMILFHLLKVKVLLMEQ